MISLLNGDDVKKMYLVNEDNGRGALPRQAEQLRHQLLALAHPL